MRFLLNVSVIERLCACGIGCDNVAVPASAGNPLNEFFVFGWV